MKKNNYNHLAQSAIIQYSPSLFINRIWSVNADANYIRRYYWKEGKIPVPDLDPTDAVTTPMIPHDENVLVALRTLSGEGVLTLRDGEYVLKENTLFFFNINQPRIYKTSKPLWNFQWIEFKIDYVFFPLNTVLHVNANARERSSFAEITRALNAQNPKYASSLFAARLVYWVQQSVTTKNRNEQLLEQVLQYIKRHFTEPLNIDDVARQFGFSARHLHTLFLSYVGMSPGQFILDMRIKNAMELLKQSDLKIEVIAEKSGFANQYYFNRRFKLYTGMPPGEYRAKHTAVQHNSGLE